MDSFSSNCLFTQGIWVKWPASLSPSTIFPRILMVQSFLSQSLFDPGTPPAGKEVVLDMEQIEDFPDRMINQIIYGFGMEVESRDRRKNDHPEVGEIHHQVEMSFMKGCLPHCKNQFSSFFNRYVCRPNEKIDIKRVGNGR